jgi:Uma2 family endonuclease
MSTTAQDLPRRHRLTVADYYRMAEVGILQPDARVELIEGEIIDMPPIGSRHAGTVDQLASCLRRAVDERAIVRVQNPIRINEHSEPEPDIALLRPQAEFYKTSHPRPSDTLLVIEVSETTFRYDRDVKTALYARHEIPEVWIIDLESQRLLRYRDPRDGAYTRKDRPDTGTAIAIEALPDTHVELNAVFAD